jgi:hypothetical protein
MLTAVVHRAMVPRSVIPSAGPMALPQEGHEFVDGADGVTVGRDEPELAAARQVAVDMLDPVSPLGHYRHAWDLPHVHERREAEVARGEGLRDLPEMVTSLVDCGGIIHISLKPHPPSVGERVEEVVGGLSSTRLEGREHASLSF